MSIDIKAIKKAAQEELNKERAERVTAALKKKLRDLDNAKQIVANIERDISDLLAEIRSRQVADIAEIREREKRRELQTIQHASILALAA